MSSDSSTPQDFIRQIIRDDLASGRHQAISTRFPPEPNGYLHLGHAKSICLNFGVAEEFGGRCNLRFDDTNPAKEDIEFARAIQEDVAWLGFAWSELRHASDYFEVFYRCAERMIETGHAYVDSLSAEQIREYRGTLTAPGRDSPYRERSPDENLALFRRMRAGDFDDGSQVLRARIDMASPNMNLRDPTLYRIRNLAHHQTGAAWCIYPMYDYAHSISDAIEGISHSLCTLEFEDHRPLYDWVLERLALERNADLLQPLLDQGLPAPQVRPRQIEFSRLNLDYTVMSKRRLQTLVQQGLVRGWDDPRMPTLCGARRRGYSPEAIREFARRIGISKQDSVIELSVLEGAVRDDLDVRAPRRMAVLRPLPVLIENYGEHESELFELANHPRNPEFGSRSVPFSRELLIERDDFMEIPPKGYHRLVPGGEVRLRGAYIIRCTGVEHGPDGGVSRVICSLDRDTRSGLPGAERKIKGTIHWVSARHGVPVQVRLFDRLFTVASPDGEGGPEGYLALLNPASEERLTDAVVEPDLANAEPEERFQFERLGYFCADRRDSLPGAPVFNRTVTLRDSWSKQAGKP